jgi:hypothetical protein
MVSNIRIVEEKGKKMAFISTKLKQHFEPIWENLEALNNKTNHSGGSAADVKEVMKSMVDNDELDNIMEEMFQLPGAMFAISTNYLSRQACFAIRSILPKLSTARQKSSTVLQKCCNTQKSDMYWTHLIKRNRPCPQCQERPRTV